jgi:hypothetical protein
MFFFRQFECTSPQNAARTFEGRREKLAGFCSKSHNGLFLILSFIKHCIIRAVKGLRWAKRLARMREMRNAWCTEFYSANVVYRGDIVMDRRMTLKLILNS